MSDSRLKAGARRLMFKNAPRLFLISAVFVVVIAIMSEFEYRLLGIGDAYTQYIEQIAAGEPHSFSAFLDYLTPIGAALALILWLVSGVVEVGFTSVCLKTTRGFGGDYMDIFNAFFFLTKTLLIIIITSTLTLLWGLLFFFPGIAAHYRYRLARYILIDDPSKSVLECIRESKRIMSGNKLDLFLLDLSFIGWILLSVLLDMLLSQTFSLEFQIPLVSIWLSPYVGITCAKFYNRLLSKIAV